MNTPMKSILVKMPESLMGLVEAQAKQEHRTKASFVREAIRTHLAVKAAEEKTLIAANQSRLAALQAPPTKIAPGQTWEFTKSNKQ